VNGHITAPLQHNKSYIVLVYFGALTLLVGSQEGRPSHKEAVPLIPKDFLREQVEETS